MRTNIDFGVAACGRALLATAAIIALSGLPQCFPFEAGGGKKTDNLAVAALLYLRNPPSDFAAGFGHTCTLDEAGSVRCWGVSGLLGDGRSSNGTAVCSGAAPSCRGDEAGEMPPPIINLGPGSALQITAGASHTCALMTTGAVRCFGQATNGALGYPVAALGAATCAGASVCLGDEPGEMPPADVNLGGPATKVVAGFDFTCALMTTGAVRCWGGNGNGQLGDGSLVNRGDGVGNPMPPPDVALGGLRAVDLSVGGSHVCALLEDGAVRCWGLNGGGQLGYDDAVSRSTPGGNVNIGGVATRLFLQGRFSCALMESGSLRCWGKGNNGELGVGSAQNRGDGVGDNMPPVDAIAGGRIVSVAGSGVDSGAICVLLEAGAVRCWGAGNTGTNGNGRTDNVGVLPSDLPPADVPVGDTPTRLVASRVGFTMCAVYANGNLRCWGANFAANLGSSPAGDGIECTTNVRCRGDEPGEMPSPFAAWR